MVDENRYNDDRHGGTPCIFCLDIQNYAKMHDKSIATLKDLFSNQVRINEFILTAKIAFFIYI